MDTRAKSAGAESATKPDALSPNSIVDPLVHEDGAGHPDNRIVTVDDSAELVPLDASADDERGAAAAALNLCASLNLVARYPITGVSKQQADDGDGMVSTTAALMQAGEEGTEVRTLAAMGEALLTETAAAARVACPRLTLRQAPPSSPPRLTAWPTSIAAANPVAALPQPTFQRFVHLRGSFQINAADSAFDLNDIDALLEEDILRTTAASIESAAAAGFEMREQKKRTTAADGDGNHASPGPSGFEFVEKGKASAQAKRRKTVAGTAESTGASEEACVSAADAAAGVWSLL